MPNPTPWIVLFPGHYADAPVYANERIARAMIEHANLETAGNVEAVTMPLDLALAAPRLLKALRATRKMLYERASMETAKDAAEVGQQCDQVDALLRELGEAS